MMMISGNVIITGSEIDPVMLQVNGLSVGSLGQSSYSLVFINIYIFISHENNHKFDKILALYL
jgi:hypothetical protein